MDPETLFKVKAKIAELKAKRAAMPVREGGKKGKKSYGSSYSKATMAEFKQFREEMMTKGWNPDEMELDEFLKKMETQDAS